MKGINGDACHDRLVAETKGILSYDSSRDFCRWKEQVAQKLAKLLGMDVIAENACPIRIEIEEITEKGRVKIVGLHLLVAFIYATVIIDKM